MVNKEYRIPCMILRGGTSKGLYFLDEDLPQEQKVREQLLLKIMGSPDINQIDGLGGGKSVTSKVAIVKVSEREDADVDYTFYQIAVDKALVSTAGNCGNISSGVGPFAIEKGLVKAREPITAVRIYNTNTSKVIIEEVPCVNQSVKYDGEYAIAGVPGTASPMKMRFCNPAGTLGENKSSGILPTGQAVDVLQIPDVGELAVSIVDASNALVFVRARDIGMRGDELPEEIDGNAEKLALLEKIRGVAAVRLGLCNDYREGEWKTPGIPKIVVVESSADCLSTSGNVMKKDEFDIMARMMSMQKTHPSYAMTGAMCTAAAAVIPGTIVAQVLRDNIDEQCIRIGHPGGVLEVGVDFEINENHAVIIKETFGFRTANLLMEGYVYS